MSILEAKDLNLWYDANHALKNINISIPERKITALIGPSGCGKSTFLKSLNRMNDLVEGCRIEGKVTFNGVDIYKDIDVTSLRKQIGMVFQKPNPFPMSIYDNIAPDGTVTADTELDPAEMENHISRKEVSDAVKYGSGTSSRYSDTLMQKTFYYAKKLDEAYKRRNEFNLITENMSEGFLIVDKNALLLSCNNSALKLLHSEKNCVGETVFTLNRTKQFRDYINTALDGKRSSSTMSLDGLTYEFIATPVFENNRIAGAVIIIIDITESTEREKMRREFTANVSHELKTPLTSISGIAELMKDGNLPKEDVIDFSQSIYDESQRLISLVGDIIKISELDEKSPCFTVEDVDLLDICGNVEKRLRRLADEKDVSVSVSGDDVHIDASPKIIDEMVYNLCENAIKYNKPHGSVSVTVENKNGAAQLSVKDTGIGIPKQDQSHVFERFYRVDKGRSKAVGGTGLGLAIVKHGAMFHGAKISLESTLDVGTEITVTFSAK